MGSIPVAGAKLSEVIVCEPVSFGCKYGVPFIRTEAIVKSVSNPSAIPNHALQPRRLSFFQ